MTRRARSGNTQKHRKMPADATPWKEFAKDTRIKSEKGNLQNSKKITIGCIEKKRQQASFNKISSEDKSKKKLVNSNTSSVESSQSLNEKEQKVLNYTESNKFNIDKNNFGKNYFEHSVNGSNVTHVQMDTVPRKLGEKYEITDASQQKMLAKPKMTNQRNEKEYLKTEKQFGKFQEEADCLALNRKKLVVAANDKTRNNKNFACNKKLLSSEFLQRGQKNRFVPLPMKVEQKLHDMYRHLQEKGVSSVEIKNIMTKRRRTEKNKLRKILCFKPCLNCRQKGHLFADCPFTGDSSNQMTNICFKCGSTEHKSSRCTKKIEGFPLAKCFICKNQGHISRECPQNNHGIYPNGGQCNLCGNINHLKKDCPSLAKKKEETVISLHTIKEGRSLDDEIIEPVFKVKTKVLKQPKIVKFL